MLATAEQIEAHGLKALRLRASGSEALVYLHGAHLASFRTSEHGELLWLSEKARYAPGKAIRGGVPICFPWFGAHARAELPAHGFARTHEFASKAPRSAATRSWPSSALSQRTRDAVRSSLTSCARGCG